jgi:hypothetical protein
MIKLFIRACIASLVSSVLIASISSASYSQARSIRAKTVISYKGGALFLEQAKVQTRKIYGIKLSPLNTTVKSGEKEIYIPHAVENLSNTTNEISVEVVSVTPEGWSAALSLDENKDGIHQWWEFDHLERPKQIGEGSMFGFLIKFKRPDNARAGDKGMVTVRASGGVKDGNGYLGGNGVNYGGEDEGETTDTFIVE